MTMKFNPLLKLDLQFFAEGEQIEPGAPGEQLQQPGEKMFTQSELDQIIKDRLEREKAKRLKEIADLEAENERKRLEEQNEFKTLYEKAQAEISNMKATQAALELAAAKKEMILKAGYAAEQLEDISALVTGDDLEAVTASFERVQKLVPVKAAVVDPQLQGSQRTGATVKTKDSYDLARERARSLLKRK